MDEKPNPGSTKVALSSSGLFFTRGDILGFKPLVGENDEGNLIKKHRGVISCLGIVPEGWLICSCTDSEVILSKQDALLKTFNSLTIAVDLGRIFSCALIIRNDQVVAAVAKSSEILLIQCQTTDSPLTKFGLLDCRKFEIVGGCDRINEHLTWLQMVLLRDLIHVIGMASGNAVSLKIWEVSDIGKLKLKDHRMSSQSKVIAGADLMKQPNKEEYSLALVSPEGYCELFAVNFEGFSLLTRIKLEDFLPTPEYTGAGDSGPAAAGAVYINFRVFSTRFFYPVAHALDLETQNEKSNDDTEDDLNNTLTNIGKRELECPKILLAVATSKGIGIFNVLSGELEFAKKFEELVTGNESLVFQNAKLSTSGSHPGIITCALQPVLQKEIYTFQWRPKLMDAEEQEHFTLLTTVPLAQKSVLRKRLKSPPPPPSKSRGSLKKSGLREKGKTAGPKWAIPKRPSSVTGSSIGPGSLPTRKLKSKPPNKYSGNVTQQPSTSRRIRIAETSKYDCSEDIVFTNTNRICLPTRLSDASSNLLMASSPDGNVMAVGGNVAPMIIFKKFPTFEPLFRYKEAGRITALDFAFSNKYLLMGTNDRKTTVINWKQEKQILSLDFNSKFNDHTHAQFYYLDKFILQPEENRIVLYAWRVQSPTSVTLQAGKFPLDSQRITAMAAPNQFYSSTVLSASSNKSLIAFDFNAEHVMVSISNAHSKPISTIRINEAPKGSAGASLLCDLFLTATNSPTDPVKIWDLRIAKCVMRIGDLNGKLFVPTSRPALSPCGRYIASGFEENTVAIYDIRKINSRVTTLKGMQSPVLEVGFDVRSPMLWCACRNGNLWNFNTT